MPIKLLKLLLHNVLMIPDLYIQVQSYLYRKNYNVVLYYGIKNITKI